MQDCDSPPHVDGRTRLIALLSEGTSAPAEVDDDLLMSAAADCITSLQNKFRALRQRVNTDAKSEHRSEVVHVSSTQKILPNDKLPLTTHSVDDDGDTVDDNSDNGDDRMTTDDVSAVTAPQMSTRRTLVRFSAETTAILEEEYAKDHYMPRGRKAILIRRTGLNEKQIRNWFWNKRQIRGHKTAPKVERVSADGKDILESFYEVSPVVTGPERKRLAELCGISETKVKSWFTYRRVKDAAKKNAAGKGEDGLEGESQVEGHVEEDESQMMDE